MTCDRVVVVGGGLAGITAAIELAEEGLPVTVLESRPWLGGATWSFGRRGLTIDNGQHIYLRCFVEYQALLDRLGVCDRAQLQDRLDLTVLTARGPQKIRRSKWPAPLHMARMLGGYHPLSRAERLAVLPAMTSMWLSDLSGHGDVSVADWLSRHGQGKRARRQLWDLFLVPVLNSAPERADLGTAAGIINAALLSSRDQADLGLTSVPLRDLHGRPAARLLGRLGAEVRLGAQVTAITRGPRGGYRIHVRPSTGGQEAQQVSFGQCEPDVINAAGVVLAVPAWAAVPLAPPELSDQVSAWRRFEPSPVVSLHITFETRVTRLPFALTADTPLRWIIDKTASAGLHGGQYLAASIPAADKFVDAPVGEIRERFLPVIERLFPPATTAGVEDFFVTRERCATFRPSPRLAGSRPDQATKLPGFALAGAWTSTGWPDTMEGAVRSGRLAAEHVLRSLVTDGAGAGGGRPRATVTTPAAEPASAAWVPELAPLAPMLAAPTPPSSTLASPAVGPEPAASEADAGKIPAPETPGPADDGPADPEAVGPAPAALKSPATAPEGAEPAAPATAVPGGNAAHKPRAARRARKQARAVAMPRADKPIPLAMPDTGTEHARAARP